MRPETTTRPTRARVCPICGQTFLAPRPGHKQRYCSHACSGRAREGSVRTAVERTCGRCGKSFRALPSALARGASRYCSWVCLFPPLTVVCRGCGDTFRVPPTGAKRQWCSAACRYRTPGWTRVLHPQGRKSCDCEICGVSFSVVASRPGRYCSRKCLGVANGQRQTASRDPSRYPTRACVECGSAYTVHISNAERSRFCSHSCRALWHNRRRHIVRPTSIEIALGAALRAAGVQVEREYRVGRFSLDFALPARKVAVEADGDYWHSLPKQQRADRRKNAALAAAGWTVLRFTETEILTDADACAAAVEAVS